MLFYNKKVNSWLALGHWESKKHKHSKGAFERYRKWVAFHLPKSPLFIFFHRRDGRRNDIQSHHIDGRFCYRFLFLLFSGRREFGVLIMVLMALPVMATAEVTLKISDDSGLEFGFSLQTMARLADFRNPNSNDADSGVDFFLHRGLLRLGGNFTDYVNFFYRLKLRPPPTTMPVCV